MEVYTRADGRSQGRVSSVKLLCVNVYRLITDNTLAEYMMDVQMFKTKLANDVLAGVKRGSLDESAKDSGAAPSGASRIGQILTCGATSEQQGNTTSEDEEYNLHAVESFIQSLNSSIITPRDTDHLCQTAPVLFFFFLPFPFHFSCHFLSPRMKAKINVRK